MKKNIVLVLSVLTLSLLSTCLVSAADLDAPTKENLVANCSTAQSTLQRISQSGTSTRINRGRDYDQILKLFYAMNARVASNNITEPKLADITKSFENKLNDFRSRYNEYNDRLKTTIDIDCKNNPELFYDDLTQSRLKRALVHDTIAELNDLIDRYQATVAELVL